MCGVEDVPFSFEIVTKSNEVTLAHEKLAVMNDDGVSFKSIYPTLKKVM